MNWVQEHADKIHVYKDTNMLVDTILRNRWLPKVLQTPEHLIVTKDDADVQWVYQTLVYFLGKKVIYESPMEHQSGHHCKPATIAVDYPTMAGNEQIFRLVSQYRAIENRWAGKREARMHTVVNPYLLPMRSGASYARMLKCLN